MKGNGTDLVYKDALFIVFQTGRDSRSWRNPEKNPIKEKDRKSKTMEK